MGFCVFVRPLQDELMQLFHEEHARLDKEIAEERERWAAREQVVVREGGGGGGGEGSSAHKAEAKEESSQDGRGEPVRPKEEEAGKAAQQQDKGGKCAQL